MSSNKYANALDSLGMCPEWVEWLRSQSSPQAAWDACERGDWMLDLLGWLAGPSGHYSRRPLVLATCECARLVLGLVPSGDDRPHVFVKTAEAWARWEGPTLEDLRRAGGDALAARKAAWDAEDFPWNVEDAARDAAWVAGSAAWEATWDLGEVSLAAEWTARAAALEAGDAAGHATLKRCAEIIRRYYPTAPSLVALLETAGEMEGAEGEEAPSDVERLKAELAASEEKAARLLEVALAVQHDIHTPGDFWIPHPSDRLMKAMEDVDEDVQAALQSPGAKQETGR